jgi:hypothetical protein
MVTTTTKSQMNVITSATIATRHHFWLDRTLRIAMRLICGLADQPGTSSPSNNFCWVVVYAASILKFSTGK